MSARERKNTSSAGYVLDTFTIMVLLRNEPGADRVQELLRHADKGVTRLYLSLINYGEVLFVVERRWGEVRLQRVVANMDSLPLDIRPVDRSLVQAAAHLKAWHHIPYADAFAAGLAQQLGVPVITGDPGFKELESEVAVEWLT